MSWKIRTKYENLSLISRSSHAFVDSLSLYGTYKINLILANTRHTQFA